MAILLLGQIASDIRGSIGGTTYARNRSGAYARNRTVPVDPATVPQSDARLRVSTLQTYFRTSLSAAERQSWRDLASATLFPNRVGQPHQLSAINLFIRTNALRDVAGAATLDVAPAAPATTAAPALTCEIDGVSGDLEVQTVAPSVQAGEYLFVSVSPPQSLNRYFYKGPWTSPQRVLTSATAIPYVLIDTADLVTGSAYFIKWRFMGSTGRVSSEFYARVENP